MTNATSALTAPPPVAGAATTTTTDRAKEQRDAGGDRQRQHRERELHDGSIDDLLHRTQQCDGQASIDAPHSLA